MATTENGQRKNVAQREKERRRVEEKPLQRAWKKDKPDDVGFDPLHAHLPR